MLCCVYLISNQSSLALAPCCLAPIEAPSCRAGLKCNLVHMIWVDQAYNMVEMQERKGPVVISVPVDYSHNHLLMEPLRSAAA